MDKVTETFTEEPRLEVKVEEVEKVMPDGSVVQRELVHQRMVRKIRTRTTSFDSQHSIVSEDEHEIDEVVPGTEFYGVAGQDTDTEDEMTDDDCDDVVARPSVGDEGQGNSAVTVVYPPILYFMS